MAKIWKQAAQPLQQIDSFVNHGWLADGSIDWIDTAFREEIESLFAKKKIDSTDDDNNFDDINELEDDDNLEEEEEVDE